eukprot:GEMP01085750.1.p2 GENE.GEMP01085750.1~~GEMP01085750.1.p2  ORF type:complete len:157 (+),score=22.40 GEMP01085750.1:32-502(+)
MDVIVTQAPNAYIRVPLTEIPLCYHHATSFEQQCIPEKYYIQANYITKGNQVVFANGEAPQETLIPRRCYTIPARDRVQNWTAELNEIGTLSHKLQNNLKNAASLEAGEPKKLKLARPDDRVKVRKAELSSMEAMVPAVCIADFDFLRRRDEKTFL